MDGPGHVWFAGSYRGAGAIFLLLAVTCLKLPSLQVRIN